MNALSTGHEAHQRIDRTALEQPQDSGNAGQQAGQRESDRDDPIGVDAHQPRDVEILSRRAHADAEQ